VRPPRPHSNQGSNPISRGSVQHSTSLMLSARSMASRSTTNSAPNTEKQMGHSERVETESNAINSSAQGTT
jgi:hypothetical protein